jgi:hypothetical protein
LLHLKLRYCADVGWLGENLYFVVLVSMIVVLNRLVGRADPFVVNDELVLMDTRSQLVCTIRQQQMKFVLEDSFHRQSLPVGECSSDTNVLTALGPFEKMAALGYNNLCLRLRHRLRL